MHYRRRVVFGVFTCTGRVCNNRCPQWVIRIGIRTACAFINHLLNSQIGFIPGDTHTNFNETRNNTGILTQRTFTFGRHTGVDKNLRHGIFRGLALLFKVGLFYGFDIIQRVIVGNKLKRIFNTIDEVLLTDNGHGVLFSYSLCGVRERKKRILAHLDNLHHALHVRLWCRLCVLFI